MTVDAPILTARFWRTRRSAAVAGIVFAVLLLAALTMARLALAEGSFEALQADAQKRALIRLSIGLVPFAGHCLLVVYRCNTRAARRGGGSARSPRCSWAADYFSWPCSLVPQ